MISTIDDTMPYILSLNRYFSAGDTHAATLAILLDLGLSVQCDGFIYLRIAIERKLSEPQLRCQDIYEAVCDEYDCSVTPAQVEQSIRSAIDSAWNCSAWERWDPLFPPEKGERRKRPSNHSFISRIACILELWSCCRRDRLG